MPNRVKRKREARLAARIKQFEADQSAKGQSSKHEHRKPGSMSGRK
jgi:hypothetical protein